MDRGEEGKRGCNRWSAEELRMDESGRSGLEDWKER